MTTATSLGLWMTVTAYAVFGGADYGAGFWTLVSGKSDDGRRARQLIRHAVGPVWEANHVWLIYSLIIFWTAFPSAFASVMTTMFAPLALAVIGIVLRGTAFAFSGADVSPGITRAWTRVYALSSVITPFLFGTVLGGVASGRVPVGNAAGQKPSAWLNPTSLVVGVFAVVVCAYLAAVFLASDARRYSAERLVDYFHRRAVGTAVVAGVMAVVGILVFREDSPYLWHGLTHEGLPFVLASLVVGGAALFVLRRGGRRFTRVLAVGAVASVVFAWGAAQYPYALPETLTIYQAAGDPDTLAWLLFAYGLAAVVVLPALAFLFVLDQRSRLEEGMRVGPQGPRHRVVIVGGGFGGLPAARLLGHTEVDVVLIDRRNHHLFQPLLYQVATGVLSTGHIAPPLRHVLRHNKNVTVELAEVTGFDIERRVVLADRFFHTRIEIPYDSLIVAAGAGQSYFGRDDFALIAPGMKTLDDALEIRRRVFGALEAAETAPTAEQRAIWMTMVVVGAGPTGVELAGQIRELAVRSLRGDFRQIDPAALRVVLVDGGAEPLANFGDRLSLKAAHMLERIGVELKMHSRVTNVDTHGVDVTAADGSTDRIATHTVLWAAGVQASPLGGMLAEATGAEVDRAGRIAVLPDLTLPGHPEIFCVGDMISLDHLPGVSEVAMQGGLHAAYSILRRLRGAHTRPFRYRDLGSMATIGRFRAVMSSGKLRLSGFPAWLVWCFIHLAFLNSFGNKFSTILRWFGAMMGHQRVERNFSVGRTAGDVSVPQDVRARILPPKFPAMTPNPEPPDKERRG